MSTTGILTSWAERFVAESLSEEMSDLIRKANHDLYTGHSEDGYPGFDSACAQISEALLYAPRTLWIDEDSGDVSEVTPQCDCIYDGEGSECCCQDFVCKYEWSEIRKAIVGQELAHYIL